MPAGGIGPLGISAGELQQVVHGAQQAGPPQPPPPQHFQKNGRSHQQQQPLAITLATNRNVIFRVRPNMVCLLFPELCAAGGWSILAI